MSLLSQFVQNISTDTVFQILASIIVGILSIGYPIIFQMLQKIDNEYQSIEFKNYVLKRGDFKIFRSFLIAGLLGIFFRIANVSPLVDWKFIENSASYILLLFTIGLIVIFMKIIYDLLKLFDNSDTIESVIRSNNLNDIKKKTILTDFFIKFISEGNESSMNLITKYFIEIYKAYRYQIMNGATLDYHVFQTIEVIASKLSDYPNEYNRYKYYFNSGRLIMGEIIKENDLSQAKHTIKDLSVINLISQLANISIKKKDTNSTRIQWEYLYNYANDFRVATQIENKNHPNYVAYEQLVLSNTLFLGLLYFEKKYDLFLYCLKYKMSSYMNFEYLSNDIFELAEFIVQINDFINNDFARDIYRNFVYINDNNIFTDEKEGIIDLIFAYICIDRVYYSRFSSPNYTRKLKPRQLLQIIESYKLILFKINEWFNNDFLKKVLLDTFHFQNLSEIHDKVRSKFDKEIEKIQQQYEEQNSELKLSEEKIAKLIISSSKIIRKFYTDYKLIQFVKIKSVRNSKQSSLDLADYHSYPVTREMLYDNTYAELVNYDTFFAERFVKQLQNDLKSVILSQIKTTLWFDENDLFPAIDYYFSNINKSDYCLILNGINPTYFTNILKISDLSHKNYKEIDIYLWNRYYLQGNKIIIAKKTELPWIELIKSDNPKAKAKLIDNEIELYLQIIEYNDLADIADTNKFRPDEMIIKLYQSAKIYYNSEPNYICFEIMSKYSDVKLPNSFSDIDELLK